MRRLVFPFGEGDDRSVSPLIRGGKGAGLAEMVRLGLPVPPGFTISTSLSRAIDQTKEFPKRLEWQLLDAMGKLERDTGKKFGDTKNPLLVSVRSGAPASMPGMMDTILNLGLTPKSVKALAAQTDFGFAYDTYRRFLKMFGETAIGMDFSAYEKKWAKEEKDAEWLAARYRSHIKTKFGKFPDEPEDQIAWAIMAVIGSWRSKRAVAYRENQKIPNWWGTAVNVQAMVFGNMGGDSGTGVVFSSNITTGEPGINGEWLPNAQGEDVVSGKFQPQKLETLKAAMPKVYDELVGHVERLEKHYNDVVDVEFTIERGKLFILQARKAKRTPSAAVHIVVHKVWDGLLTKEAAVKAIPEDQLKQVIVSRVDEIYANNYLTSFTQGEAVSQGAASGRVATTSEQAKALFAAHGQKPILVVKDTTPDDLPGMLVSAGIVTCVGGATSHAAVVARGLGIPCVVGCAGLKFMPSYVMSHTGVKLNGNTLATMDGSLGKVWAGQGKIAEAPKTRELRAFLRWLTGSTAFRWPEPKLVINWGKPSRVEGFLNDFYLMEAMLRSTASGSFRRDLEVLYRQKVPMMSEIIAGYLMIACAGELRHGVHPKGRYHDERPENKQGRELMTALCKTYGLTDTKERSAVQKEVCEAVLKQPPEAHRKFMADAEIIFNGNWGGGHVGGPKWGNIAGVCRAYLCKEMPASILLDHAFDLQHNTGTVFNKRKDVIEYNSGYLAKMLNIKKNESDINRLYAQLTQVWSGMDPEVKALYERGKGKVW